MIDDFMRSERETVEFLLENYKVYYLFCNSTTISSSNCFQVLIYDGNFDIICNHSGVLKMIDAMENWSGKDQYYRTKRDVWSTNGKTAGYLKSVKNLRLFVMRNAGHMVPRSQPEFSFDMFNSFIYGQM